MSNECGQVSDERVENIVRRVLAMPKAEQDALLKQPDDADDDEVSAFSSTSTSTCANAVVPMGNMGCCAFGYDKVNGVNTKNVERYHAGLRKAKEGGNTPKDHVNTILSRPYVNLWTLAFTAPPVSVLIAEDIANPNSNVTPPLVHLTVSYVYRTLPIVVWISQLVLIVTLVNSIVKDHQFDTICPNTRESDVKLAAAAVGVSYFTRIVQRGSKLYSMTFDKQHGGKDALYGDRLPSFATTFDFWYSQSFDYFVMGSNMYYVFSTANSVQEVILNAIKFEFIGQMDDKYVTAALNHPVISKYIVAMDALSDDDSRPSKNPYTSRSSKKHYKYGECGLSVLAMLLAIATFIYIPICM